MAEVHGKETYVSLDGDDLSPFSHNSEINDGGDSHDITTYGMDAHFYGGGLSDGTAMIEGRYDSGATGPRAIIAPLLRTRVVFVRRPQGTGAGLPMDTVTVLVENYTETNPVNDYIKWKVDLKLSGTVDRTAQA